MVRSCCDSPARTIRKVQTHGSLVRGVDAQAQTSAAACDCPLAPRVLHFREETRWIAQRSSLSIVSRLGSLPRLLVLPKPRLPRRSQTTCRVEMRPCHDGYCSRLRTLQMDRLCGWPSQPGTVTVADRGGRMFRVAEVAVSRRKRVGKRFVACFKASDSQPRQCKRRVPRTQSRLLLPDLLPAHAPGALRLSASGAPFLCILYCGHEA